MDVRVTAGRRRPGVATGSLWLARLTLAYAFVAVAGSWFLAASTGTFDLLRAGQASLSAAVALVPLVLLVIRHKLEGTLR